MSDTIDINVNKIVETIDVFANFEHPNVEINTIEIVDNVEINATPNVVQININSISGDVEWGEIEGILSNQTDLQNALDLKANASDLGDVAFSNDYNDLDNLPTIPNNLEELHNVTETNYTTPIDVDSLLTFDVTNSLWKRLSWANIKSNLKTYFDNIYQTALGFTPENLANKATNLTSPDNTKYPTTLAVSTALSGKQNTLTNPITGTGTTNRISKFTASGTIGDSQIFNNGTNVGIGAESTSARLDVRAQGALATDIAFRVRNSADTANIIQARGNGDVFIGLNSGNITTGGGNTAFGQSTLTVNTSGYNNTAIGFAALFQNTTGFSNTAVGRQSLYANTTGTSNTAIGLQSLYANTTGTNNTAIGLQSLYANTTGTNNTSLGIQSLSQLTSGNSNLALGASSAQKISDGNNLTSSTNSIFIGQNTRALENSQTNQIVIGYNAIGLGSNSVVLGNTSITRTALRGQTSINTDTIDASAQLQVDSTTRGFLPPRMTTTQRDAIASPAAGLIVYDTTENKHYGYNGTTWNAFY